MPRQNQAGGLVAASWFDCDENVFWVSSIVESVAFGLAPRDWCTSSTLSGSVSSGKGIPAAGADASQNHLRAS
ncbi:hypothetical protein J2S92_003581 [Arthrobacter bambusae]|nr:hypothetical protein [Arthrobacter bambusae]MDQ0212882.1 hypothetical protein [Arthrobacter bambusae]MDQ0237188.1 hypothetical protein [Arthrobacter bambusae]